MLDTFGSIASILGLGIQILEKLGLKKKKTLTEDLEGVADRIESKLVGVWEATDVDMSFAVGKIPEDKMEEARQNILGRDAPSFELRPDGTAHIFGTGVNTRAEWIVDGDNINIKGDQSSLYLERKGECLITLPDRTFTLTRR